jgi:hypothetical protein
MGDFDLFESLVTAQSEDRIRQDANERSLKEAAFDVRRQFGAYLGNAESTSDYDERFAYLKTNIATVLEDKVEPTTQVMAWLSEELKPEHLHENPQPKTGTLARRGDSRSAPKTASTKQARDPRTVVGGVDWQWDNESNSFKSTKSSNFQCVCGSGVEGVGQHTCKCGRLWNLSSIVDGNKTASPPTFVCREVMRRDTHLGKKADMVDPMKSNEHKQHGEHSPDADSGYDVDGLIGPAVGEGEHDEHLSALDLIFAADSDNDADDAATANAAGNDSTGNVSAATEDEPDEFISPEDNNQPPLAAPMPPPPPAGPSMMNGDPAGIEDQPAEDSDIQGAQQAILDMILREKAEEVTEEKSNHDEIQNLNDAYQSLDVVQDLENAEMMDAVSPMAGMPAPQLATYRAGAKFGYVLGYLEAIADNSYEDRKTDFKGFEPPIPGISNGLDDADLGHPKETDTTDELRELLKNQFDKDNADNKTLKPLDPAQPFGKDKGKSSRFRTRA